MNEKCRAHIRRKLKELPTCPGVYFHKNGAGEVIYVGKAAVLKNRVRQYFHESSVHDNKTMALVQEICDVDWIDTESEIDALFLESEMIKRYKPQYNVLLRDDKSQLFVRIDMKSEWPTVTCTRNPLDDGAEYIGPFYNGFALKKALRYLRPAFPHLMKDRRPRQSRLDEDLGLSPKISDGSAAYKAQLKQLMRYLNGGRKAIIREMEREMKQFAREQRFEEAARLRNKIRALAELQRRVMFGDKEFLQISKDKALSDLQKIFGLLEIPRRIEGFDISHMSGKNAVASMVVFQNGVSNRAEYRKFKVSEKNDDAGNMRQVIYRRFSQKNRKAWLAPQLVLIDGGKAQVLAAIRARNEQAMRAPIVGIAKREEEIIIHKTESQIDIENLKKYASDDIAIQDDGAFLIVSLHPGQMNASSHSKNLRAGARPYAYDDITKLFQRIRDESHRFAVSYHASLRTRAGTKNALEDIPGVGPKTRAALLRHFGGLGGVKAASERELAAVVSPKMAQKIHAFLKSL